MSILVRGLLAGAALTAALHGAALAEGAIAIGATGNFAKDGFAFGAAIDKPSQEAAREQALTTCRRYQGAPKMAAICRLMFTFTRECYALSYDPKPGTPGVGWAIAADKPTAEDRAQKNCEVTAGADRRGYCKVNQSFCDTHD
jgi:uncharacterized protein DUF4189